MARDTAARHWVVPLGIVALAAVLRLVALATVPLGLHGDEAVTGMDARRVLTEGWLGPYLPYSALGQPAGPVYGTALLFAVLPQTTATIRASMALFSIAAVLFTYLAARQAFDRGTAALAALLLTFMPWHLHLGRVGFMVNAWPCVQMAALWLVWRAGRRRRPLAAALAGVAIGLCPYTYNAAWLSLPVLALPLLYEVAAAAPAARRAALLRLALTGAVALLTLLPMLHYMATSEEYADHFHDVGVVPTEQWQNGDWPARARLLLARGAEWGRGLVLSGRPDDGDGLGERGYPLLDPLISLTALVGFAMALRRWRTPAGGVLLAALLLLPLGALLTIEDGLYRRTFGLAPFIAMAAALPLGSLWARTPDRLRTRLALGLGALLAAMGSYDVYRYFGPLQATEEMRYVYPYDLDAAARYVAALPEDTLVYFYSERWPARYETIQWFAPRAKLVDRAPEFVADGGGQGDVDFSADRDRAVVFLLLGRYRDRVDLLEARYPEGALEEGVAAGEVVFRAYRVPAAPLSGARSPSAIRGRRQTH